MHKKTKEEVLVAIRNASKSINGSPLSETKFLKLSHLTVSDIRRFFAKWSIACNAAEVAYDNTREKVTDEKLLEDWGQVARKLQHIPSANEYKVDGKHGQNAFKKRFGTWDTIPEKFETLFTDSDEWKDVLEIVKQRTPRRIFQKKKSSIKINQPINYRSWPKLDKRPIYGAPIDFRGLRHEPINEQGVVFLFGMVAKELGYLVEAVQGGYPDCEAKRQVGKSQWQPVRIEFEFDSRNFLDHLHDPNICDIIVCWVHNWTECPANIEVLALSEIILNLETSI